jgi:hypothetical protein
LNESANTLVGQSPGQDNFISDDDDVGATECKMSNAMHGHACDPLVRADRSVQFGDDPANDTYIAAGASLPCLPSITAACPAIQLPPPVFSGATTAGIVVGSVTCALIIAMIASTVAEHCTPKSATLAPVLPVVAPKPVAKPQALPPPPQAKPTKQAPPPPPAKPSKPAVLAPVDLDTFWTRTGLKFSKINKKKM